MLLDFLPFEKVNQRKRFCVKNEIKFIRALEIMTAGLAGVLVAEHRFSCGITSLNKAEKMSMTMLVLVARSRQQTPKTLKQ